jgi:hypothetical protein
LLLSHYDLYYFQSSSDYSINREREEGTVNNVINSTENNTNHNEKVTVFCSFTAIGSVFVVLGVLSTERFPLLCG